MTDPAAPPRSAGTPRAVVVTDLDGTIVRPDGSISRATARSLGELDRAGVPVVLATARTPFGVRALPELASLASVVVCCNGALGYLPRTGAVLWQHDIAPHALDAVLAGLAENVPDAGVGLFDGRRWLLDARYVPIRGKTPRGPSTTVAGSLRGHPGTALGICHQTLTSAELSVLLRAAPGVDRDVTISFAADDILDVTAPDVDKGTGTRQALEHLGLDPALAVAFGDAPNDLPMFALAGRSVAVANAHPAVLAAASATTHSVLDDGFSAALAACGIL